MRTPLAEDQDSCALLEQLAEKHNFSVTYASLEQRAHSGAFQVLLQLGTLPVAVVHGSSLESDILARERAAYNALHYLMLMTSSAEAASAQRITSNSEAMTKAANLATEQSANVTPVEE